MLITVGGCDENCDEATAVESYNPLSGQWRSLDPFAGNLRGGYATVALGNDIFVTGKEICRQRGVVVRSVVFTTTMIARLMVHLPT